MAGIQARNIGRGLLLFLGSLLVLMPLALRAETPSDRVLEVGPLQVRGRWIVGTRGRATPPGSFTRGLQTSGLVYHRGRLLSVGDQRSAFAGHILVLDADSGRLCQPAVGIRIADSVADTAEVVRYRATVNPDFEGLTIHPDATDIALAVTEDKVPWVAKIHLRWKSSGAEGGDLLEGAEILALTRVAYPQGLEAWRGDTNFRLEGCTIPPGRNALYVAFERARDDLPRLLRMELVAATAGVTSSLSEVRLDFSAVARRGDKSRARLNVNGIAALKNGLVIAVARDQERLLLLDPQAGVVRRVVDLDLRAPDGERIQWVSPEGVAIDEAGTRLWIVNDPDSMRGNYRARDAAQAEGRFAEFAPLLFEIPLADVLGPAR